VAVTPPELLCIAYSSGNIAVRNWIHLFEFVVTGKCGTSDGDSVMISLGDSCHIVITTFRRRVRSITMLC
jgi:hypothetical protein